MGEANTHQTTIGGRQVLVVERTPPLPQHLDDLFGALRNVRVSRDLVLLGATRACEARLHPSFEIVREGRFTGPDRVTRDLRVEMCPACGATCVRDVSFDSVPGLRVGGKGPARRDAVLGWYSGKRPAGRSYS